MWFHVWERTKSMDVNVSCKISHGIARKTAKFGSELIECITLSVNLPKKLLEAIYIHVKKRERLRCNVVLTKNSRGNNSKNWQFIFFATI